MKESTARANQPLNGHIALVTGGAKRIGAAIVEAVAAAGAEVVIHYGSSAKEADARAAAVRKRGRKAWTIQADLATKAGRAGLVAAASNLAGHPITLLVNSASSFPKANLAALDLEHLQSNIVLNAWAPFELTRAVAAQLPARQTGAVVNLIDARIADYDWGHVGYWLAKRMLADFTKLCAVEFAPRLTVNGVLPGAVLGPSTQPMSATQEKAFLRRMAKHIPLGRTPTPQAIAAAVVHLLGAATTTGTFIEVDGGRHLGRAVYG